MQSRRAASVRGSTQRSSAELDPAHSAGPRVYLVAHGEQGEVLAVGVADLRGHWGDDDVECSVR